MCYSRCVIQTFYGLVSYLDIHSFARSGFTSHLLGLLSLSVLRTISQIRFSLLAF